MSCVLITPADLLAKRRAPKTVESVSYDGVTYSADLSATKIGIVKATSKKKSLWEKTVYTIKYDESLERDVQWVFISGLSLTSYDHSVTYFKMPEETETKRYLIIENEGGYKYQMDLGSKKVRALNGAPVVIKP